jgi:hypothetical protein
MTTLASMIADVRLELDDEPAKVHLNGAISSTSEETVVLDSGETSRLQVDVRLQYDDTSGEEIRVVSITSTTDFECERGYRGTTAATHLDNAYLLIAPRYSYNQISEAITVALNQVWTKGVFNTVERAVTSSSSTDYYNLPASTVKEILGVYQFPTADAEPTWLSHFGKYPLVMDTDDFASGYAIWIRENIGVAGTEVYNIICKEPLTITDLSTQQEPIVKWLACAELLDGREPRRLGGPTNQGDRTVRPGETQRSSAWYRAKAEELIMGEKSDLRSRYPARRNWIGA